VNGPGRTTGAKYNPSLIYLNKVEAFRTEPPPADWDGVDIMKDK
jgi:hypothetical protein